MKEYPVLKSIDFHIDADAVDQQYLAYATDQRNINLRAQYGLSDDDTVALYAGSLYEGRGIELILKLATRIPSVSFFVLGGTAQDIQSWQPKSLTNNIIFQPAVPNPDVPDYLQMADVLLMPYAKQVFGRDGRVDTSAYASPMKMFEYMAARRPIVTSDLSVLRHVLHDKNAMLCPPEDVIAWQLALSTLQQLPQYGQQLAERAFADAQQYTWEKRARRILSAIGHTITSDLPAADDI